MKKKPKNSFIDLGVIEMDKVLTTFAEKEDANYVPLNVYFLHDDVEEPKYQTNASACFDIPVYLNNSKTVTIYNRLLIKIEKAVFITSKNQRGFYLEPGECAFVPSGLVFDIPKGFKLSLYPRSGVASKRHLKLANSVGVIDEDFTNELMMLIFNDSQQKQSIFHGDRLVQAEITPVYRAVFERSEFSVESKGDRDGGFGSTGGIAL